MRTTIGILAGLILLAPAWAQNGPTCGPEMTRGTYSVMCTGYISPAAGASQVPVSVLGTVIGDWNGNFTGSAKVSIGGTIAEQTVSGTMASNGDCTGSISYDQKMNGQPAPKLNIVAHVVNYGAEIRGMSVDAGVTMTCRLKLMSR